MPVPLEGQMRSRFALLTVLTVLGAARGAYAQGCALCYTTASAAGAAAERSLDYGILTLLVPALTLFLCVIFLLYRRAVAATA
jgi:hypothetical protein